MTRRLFSRRARRNSSLSCPVHRLSLVQLIPCLVYSPYETHGYSCRCAESAEQGREHPRLLPVDGPDRGAPPCGGRGCSRRPLLHRACLFFVFHLCGFFLFLLFLPLLPFFFFDPEESPLFFCFSLVDDWRTWAARWVPREVFGFFFCGDCRHFLCCTAVVCKCAFAFRHSSISSPSPSFADCLLLPWRGCCRLFFFVDSFVRWSVVVFSSPFSPCSYDVL